MLSTEITYVVLVRAPPFDSVSGELEFELKMR